MFHPVDKEEPELLLLNDYVSVDDLRNTIHRGLIDGESRSLQTCDSTLAQAVCDCVYYKVVEVIAKRVGRV